MARLVNLTNSDIDSNYSLQDYTAKDASGDKMGDITGVIADADSMQPRYLVVDSGGWFSSKQYVVPMGEVDHVDDGEQDVYFRTLTKDALKDGSYPQYDESWWDSNNGQAFGEHEQRLASAYDGRSGATTLPRGAVTNRPTDVNTTPADRAMANQRPIDYGGRLYQRPTENAGRLQLMEEHLRANKERYQAGTVRLGKRVIERQESIDVPVTEERVVIERHAVSDGRPANREFGSDQTIEVPIERERVNVQKEAVVNEEVGLRKETTQRTERVQDTVRKEELDVRDEKGLLQNQGTPVADREGRQPDPALRNRASMDRTTGDREGVRPADEMRDKAGMPRQERPTP
jgi:uncharacterized protein (TIGR02271 family)